MFRSPFAQHITRRSCLVTAAGLSLSAWTRAGDPPQPVPDADDEDLHIVGDYLKDAAVGSIRHHRSRYFLVGGAGLPVQDLSRIGRFCDAIRTQFLDTFQVPGLPVHPPNHRLTIVALAGNEMYRKLAERESLPMGTAGFYKTKLSTVFVRVERLEEDSTRTDWESTLGNLGHEVVHQLAHLSGLVSYSDSVPNCVIEGVATLGEICAKGPRILDEHRPNRLGRIARLNAGKWIPLRRLLIEDQVLSTPPLDTILDAYAQSWFIVRTLLKYERRRFLKYLVGISSKQDTTDRLADGKRFFGDLDALDTWLRRMLNGFAKQPRSSFTSPRRSSSSIAF